jgi:hypothetical protein
MVTFLDRRSFPIMSKGHILDLISVKQAPRSKEMTVHVELPSIIVNSENCSMNTYNIADSINNREILKSFGKENNCGEIFTVDGIINDFYRADELFF